MHEKGWIQLFGFIEAGTIDGCMALPPESTEGSPLRIQFSLDICCLLYFISWSFHCCWRLVICKCVWYQSVGADVNQKLFRGFATTAAVREDHLEILAILIKAGASQLACEEALLEASCHGRPRLAELLMGSELIRPHIAVHALVTASCRGFVDVVDTLIKVLTCQMLLQPLLMLAQSLSLPCFGP